MPRDILIVDDVRSALENYGNEVRFNLGIEPFLADDPVQAFDILRYYPLKALVTDQEMPKMTGTELVLKARDELNLHIPCIMLTGYGDKIGVAEAVNLGFFRFIDKVNAHAELAQAIREAIRRYDSDLLADSFSNVNEVLSKKSHLIRINPKIQLRLVRVGSVVDPFVREKDWATVHVAQKGIKTTKGLSIERSVSSKVEFGAGAEAVVKMGFKIGKLLSSLETSGEGKMTFEAKVSEEEEVVVKAAYKIEIAELGESASPEGLVLRAREYQVAPVYRRVNCILQLDCTCCGVAKVFDVSVDVPTSRVALRQVERFDRGATKVIYTGFLGGKLVFPGQP